MDSPYTWYQILELWLQSLDFCFGLVEIEFGNIILSEFCRRWRRAGQIALERETARILRRIEEDFRENFWDEFAGMIQRQDDIQA